MSKESCQYLDGLTYSVQCIGLNLVQFVIALHREIVI